MKEKKLRTNDKSSTEYSKTSCVNCKRGHRKCDKLLSGCSYCEKTGKVCSYRAIARRVARNTGTTDLRILNDNDNDDENDLSHHQHYHPYLPSTTTLTTNNTQYNQQQQCQQPQQEQDLIHHLELSLLSPPASPQYSISERNDDLSIVVGGEMLMLEQQQQQQQQQQQDSLLVNFDDYDLLHHPPSSPSPSISQPSFTTEESKSPFLLFHPYSSSASSSSLSSLLSPPLPPPMGDTPPTSDIHASSNMTMQQQQQSVPVLVESTNKKTNSLMDIASTLERIENMQQQLLEQYQLAQHNQQQELARQIQYDNRSGHMAIPMNLNLNGENENNCLVLRGRDDSLSASTRGSNSDNKSNDEINNDSSSSGSGKIVEKRMIDEIISSFASHHSDRKLKSSRSPEFNSDAILMDDDMLSAPIYFPFDRRINNLTELMTNRSNMDSVMKAYFNVFCMGVPLMGTSESLEVATELTSFQHVDQMIENRGKKSNTLLFLAIQTCCLQRLGHSDIARQLYNYCLQLLTQQMFGCPCNHSDKDRDGNLACALITLAFYLIGEGRDNKQQVKLFLVNCRFYVSNIMQNRSETQQVLDSEARSNRFSRLSAIYKYMNLIELVLNDDDLDDSIEIIKRFVSIFDGVCGKNAKHGKSCSSLQV